MVAIGVTGHRILTELDKIEVGIAEALRHIAQRFPNRRLKVLSSLAEGADRLVARSVLGQTGSRLVAVLPLPRSEYLADFATVESRQEFLQLLDQADEVVELPPASTREAAYEAAGAHVLSCCDVLLTVWDGQGAQGQGGTGEVVARARARGLPIAWVHAGNRKPGTLQPTSLGGEQGKVTFEGL